MSQAQKINQAQKMRTIASQSFESQQKSEYSKTLSLIRQTAKRPAYNVRVTLTYQSTVDKLRGEGFVVTTESDVPLSMGEQEFLVSWAEEELVKPKKGIPKK